MRVRWQNYRGYADTRSLRFTRLTLLVGANNAGKTSLYSPLLLLKQTLDSARPSTALLSQGPLFDAGRYRDFVRDHNPDSEVTFTLELPPGVYPPLPKETNERLRDQFPWSL